MIEVTVSSPLPFLSAEAEPSARRWIRALQAAMPDEHVVAFEDLDASERAACEIAIVANPRPEDVLALPNLKWVHSVWAGVERLVAELPAGDLKIVRLVDPELARTMAEAVLAWTLYLHRDMPRYARQQSARQWLQHEYVRPEAKTVSLLGLGVLGAASAAKLREAGFQVCGWSRRRKASPGVRCHAGTEELAAMLARTDILVCLLPLTARTRGIVNAETLGALRAGAALINFARGPIVDDAALRSALDAGRVSHAVLDVFDREPLPADAWQWAHPHVTVLPHISAATDPGTASAIVAANVRRYRESGVVAAAVDRGAGY
jgi:glyoxylate/hydroxypyruvate reductase A